jgi:hypothetical protein
VSIWCDRTPEQESAAIELAHLRARFKYITAERDAVTNALRAVLDAWLAWETTDIGSVVECDARAECEQAIAAAQKLLGEKP